MKNNTKFNSSPHDLRCGDVVLMRNEQKTNKLAPNFDPYPYIVVAKKGSIMSVSPAPWTEKRTTLNASCFKRIPNTFPPGSVEPELAEGEAVILDEKLNNSEQKMDATSEATLKSTPTVSCTRPVALKDCVK